MSTPIENAIDWKAHRAAALAVRSAGGHYMCSQAIGFQVTRRPGEMLDQYLGQPCATCMRLWHDNKQQQKGKAA